jgi:intracellular sulfur oxidation DsrE/DsrF family protein
MVMKAWLTIGAAAAVLAGLASPALGQSEQVLLIPGVGAELDVPGAHEMPDPGRTYKVVFDVVAAASDVDETNPGLVGVARFVNTLAKHGVPAEHRQILLVLHREATEVILENGAFRSRHDGHDNPNIELIQSLTKAGVEIRQCGQALIGREIDPETVLPEVQVDYWALTTLLKFQLDGYVKVGG